MSSTGIPPNPSPNMVLQLLQRMTDADPDFRFMSLNDLLQVLTIAKPDLLHHEYNIGARTVDALTKALDDQNGEVQNLAVKCAVSRVVIPRLMVPAQHQKLQAEQAKHKLPAPPPCMFESAGDVTPEAVDVLIEVARCFGPLLQTYEAESMVESLLGLLETEKGSSVTRKRAVAAISIMALYISDAALQALINHMSNALQTPKASSLTRRLYIAVMGAMARCVPRRFSYEQDQRGEDTAPDFNEVHEAALVTLESFLSACPQEMRPYTDDTIDACLRFLKYDPNYAFGDAEDDEDMESDDESDDEDEDDDLDDGFDDDDDDSSWKVRRCAAKALYTLISTRASGDLLESGVLYQRTGPTLIKRFEEREENVRLEVISVLSLLIRKTGEGVVPVDSIDDHEHDLHGALPINRKRRRQSSVGGGAVAPQIAMAGLGSPIQEKAPAVGPHADLAKLSPSIIKASIKQLKGKVIPTKQAIVSLLDDIVNTQRGGLGEFFAGIWGPIMDCLLVSGAGGSSSLALSGGNASATPTTLRITTLRLISDISKTHPSTTLHPYLAKIVTGVIKAVNDKFYKISSEAIRAAEELVKTITPPRSRHTAQKFKPELRKLFDIIMDRANSTSSDAEVRQRALHALGTLLSRTSSADGAALLSLDLRQAALGVLLARLKNETTRLASAKAIETVAAFNTSSAPFEKQWIQDVALELSSLLRKSNRGLRGASTQALKHLVMSPACKGQLEADTVSSLVSSLLPVIADNDAYLMGHALMILGVLVTERADLVLSPELTKVLCSFLKDGTPSVVLDPLLYFVTNVGESQNGKDLMRGLLQIVGVQGDATVLGQLIGTLLVSGGDSTGVSIEAFTKELENGANDDTRVSLALAVLGEAGMRLASQSTLPPELFLNQFRTEPDRVSRAAAVALGRAGSTNIGKYLPVILPLMSRTGNMQYLLVQSIKEVLQQLPSLTPDIEAYIDTIWNRLLEASQHADNRIACAECIGRLVILDGDRFMPRLQGLLKDQSSALRGMAVQAVRYTLPESGEDLDSILKNVLVDMLYTMFQDSDMEIRRLAMTTLNSAAHNKPDLILPHIGNLMPFVLHESVIKPELIREVMMGPFKHKVDDGLEVRKSAYETLYALMETVFSRINNIDFYDRVVSGLRDENDIRALCNLMVAKLAVMDPDETVRRLDSIAEAYRAILSTKLKEGAVKQDVEKHTESNKSILRVTLLLQAKLKGTGTGTGAGASRGDNKSAPGPTAASGVGVGGSQVWNGYWDWVVKDFATQLKVLREENRELNRV
ncbi:unnamed protein product [Parascedosporium putredinis]|uniref:TATA-binding protein interacting (TIP20) domain-containing protein n=1 Tax=Parascedosporium putredinis TaxID=1442378 RepID=A0A9P1H395_9PEZI|nr:unnamed protein product [Parascedosporium putredinis]CAI7994959.1 unnamed protein product [Parascedosporium putredinis]